MLCDTTTVVQFEVSSVAAGVDNSAVVTKRGELFTWGFNGPDCKLGYAHSHAEWKVAMHSSDPPYVLCSIPR